MVKVTFTLDDETVRALRRTAARLKKPQSQVVREAVAHYEARSDRLTDAERKEKLRILDEYAAKIPRRSAADVDRELREIRLARRSGGRLHPAE